IVLSGDLTCLFAKATIDESNLWHRRLGFFDGLLCISAYLTACFFAVSTLSVVGLSAAFTNSALFVVGLSAGLSHVFTNLTAGLDKMLSVDSPFLAVQKDLIKYPRSTIVNRHLKTPYEIFHGRIPNIDFLYVFGCPIYIHNHKDYLGKFDEKADDGYFLGYSLVSKAFRVFNTRRQQTEETYHITFDESTDAIKFIKPLVDNINIAESERYPPDEYLHSFKPS
nr:retrovirus-related Pol polyprotein from transposon TNT 1-94 [Tanacetum cinerariifolium]